MLIIISALAISLVGEFYIQVHNWREAVKSEVESSISLIQRLVGSELVQNNIVSVETRDALVGTLKGLRHVQILEQDKFGNISALPGIKNLLYETRAPDWFVQFIYPYHDTLPKVVVAKVKNFQDLIIVADPIDEITEVWEDFRTQLMIIILFALGSSILVYLGLHFGLKPLNNLLSGFEKLETGSFDIKLNENITSELSIINQKFNHMVSVLQHTSEDNTVLARKMVNLQEEERKAITRELHDEMAPHLFAIRVSTSNAYTLIDNNNIDKLAQELKSIDGTIENL
ncbi:MAG: histidine kinase, partial [Thiotrichales bacterium]|nr:histidine kinase [Thiotrichales bacterium]